MSPDSIQSFGLLLSTYWFWFQFDIWHINYYQLFLSKSDIWDIFLLSISSILSLVFIIIIDIFQKQVEDSKLMVMAKEGIYYTYIVLLGSLLLYLLLYVLFYQFYPTLHSSCLQVLGLVQLFLCVLFGIMGLPVTLQLGIYFYI